MGQRGSRPMARVGPNSGLVGPSGGLVGPNVDYGRSFQRNAFQNNGFKTESGAVQKILKT